MRIFGLLIAGFVAYLLMADVSKGGEVTGLIEFQPNTTAKSSEVNENFNRIRDAVNDNNRRIDALESFKGNLSSSCPAGQSVVGVSPDGTLTCEDMNKGEKKLAVSFHPSCFAVSGDPASYLPKLEEETLSGSYKYQYVWAKDIDSSTTLPTWLFCPIFLPHGAKITKFCAMVYDGDSSYDMVLNLEVVTLLGGKLTLASVRPTGMGTIEYPCDDATNLPYEVTVGNTLYVIFSTAESKNLRVYGGWIYYTIDPTLSLP